MPRSERRSRAVSPTGRAERVYRALFDHMLNAFALHEIVTDDCGTPVDYLFLEVNAAFEEQTGLRAQDIIGKRVTEVIPGIGDTGLIQIYGEVALTGEPVRFDQYVEPLHRHYSISAFSPGHSQFAVIFSDITQHVRAKDSLKRYQLLADHAREIILFVRLADGGIVEANEAAVRAYGYPYEELLTKTIQELRAPETVGLASEQMARADAEGTLFETIHCRSDGSVFPVEVSSLGTDVGGERILLSIVRDMTERRRAEKQRSDFLHMAAHEMKTPLATLKGYVQILLRLGGHDEREREALGVLDRQTKRLARLVQRLLDASRIQSGEWTISRVDVDFCKLVEEAIGAAQDLERVPIALTLRCERPCIVFVDQEQVREVLLNVLDNAIRYGSEGNPVTVDVEARADEVVVSIQDNGPGIRPEDRARLFEAWYQAAPMVRPTAGMGLGLYVSRAIVDSHGGRIWVESEEGKGSRFSFALPVRRRG